MSDGGLVTAKYVSAVYVYILYIQLSGRLRYHFRIVEPGVWNGIDSKTFGYGPVSSIMQS